MKIRISKLENLIDKVLSREYSKEEARLMKEIIMFGELSGRPSHGILRLIKGNYGVFVDGPRSKPEYTRKTKVSTHINANGNPGMLIGPLAMQEAVGLAKEHSFGIVGTNNSYNSIGSLSYYCEKIAKENYIAIIMAQTSPNIAPFTSVKPLFGTNPIAFGIPSIPAPVIFDMSTAAVTYGSLMKYASDHKELPSHVALDSEGNATSDPEKAMKGSILAFDASYKGSGLAMMIEMLSALWTGASYEGLHKENGWGSLFMVFSPELLSDSESLKQNTVEFIQTLKHSRTTDGKNIRIPGEHTIEIRNRNTLRGEIEISNVTYEKILEQLPS